MFSLKKQASVPVVITTRLNGGGLDPTSDLKRMLWPNFSYSKYFFFSEIFCICFLEATLPLVSFFSSGTKPRT